MVKKMKDADAFIDWIGFKVTYRRPLANLIGELDALVHDLRDELSLHRNAIDIERFRKNFHSECISCELSGGCPFGLDRGDWIYQTSASTGGSE